MINEIPAEELKDKYAYFDVHLVPNNPSAPHMATLQCWCHPVQDEHELTVFIHNHG